MKCLCRKYATALDGVNLIKGPYEELSNSLDPDKVKCWREAADAVASTRGDALDIYTLKIETG